MPRAAQWAERVASDAAMAMAPDTVSIRFLGFTATKAKPRPRALGVLRLSTMSIHLGSVAAPGSRGRARHCLQARTSSSTPTPARSSPIQATGPRSPAAALCCDSTSVSPPTTAKPPAQPERKASAGGQRCCATRISVTAISGTDDTRMAMAIGRADVMASIMVWFLGE